jgi:hypothetical protein
VGRQWHDLAILARPTAEIGLAGPCRLVRRGRGRCAVGRDLTGGGGSDGVGRRDWQLGTGVGLEVDDGGGRRSAPVVLI